MERGAAAADGREAGRESAPRAGPDKRYNFSEFDVLLLNGNVFMQRLIGDMLRSFGCTKVFGARDTDVAWAEVTGRSFDFLLVDWMVAPLDGCAFLRNIRQSANKEIECVPVIMLTGHAEQYRVEAARDAGVNEFLTLPLAPVTLFDRIVSLIERPRPYIRTKSFFGPDRRRRRDAHDGPYRRAGDADDLRAKSAAAAAARSAEPAPDAAEAAPPAPAPEPPAKDEGS